MRSRGQWPLVRAVATGGLAYAAGYFVTLAWLAARGVAVPADLTVRVRAMGGQAALTDPTLASLVGEVTPSTLAAWFLANAHFVRVVEWSFPTAGAVVPNLLLAGPPTRLLLFVVPPAVLLAAGAILARNAVPDTVDELPVIRATLPAGVVRGMALWAGYLPAAVAAAFLASAPTGHPTMAPFAPGLVGTVLVMGFGYPLAFGGLGGWLATRVRAARESGDDPESRPAA